MYGPPLSSQRVLHGPRCTRRPLAVASRSLPSTRLAEVSPAQRPCGPPAAHWDVGVEEEVSSQESEKKKKHLKDKGRKTRSRRSVNA